MADLLAIQGLGLAERTFRTLPIVAARGTTNSGGNHVVVDAFDVTGSSGSPTWVRIEDNDPAVAYAGDWVHLSEARGTNGTGTESFYAGDTATLSFTGTAVSWVSFGYNTSVIARVSIDGTVAGGG